MQNKKKLVSIILNCYNGEKYLQQALNSIEKQSYKNWELIFWDNRSTDNSKNILKSFKNKKFKYYYSKKHTSLYEARNLAIKKCRGKFISFIDADDLWERNKLKKQVELFLRNKRVSLIYSNLWIQNENLKKRKLYWKKDLPSGSIYKKIIKEYCIGIITVMIKRNILPNKNTFNSKYSIIGDFDLFIRLAKKNKFMAVQAPLATYRIHGDNLSLKNRMKEIDELKHWLKNNKYKLQLFEKKFIQNKIDFRNFLRLKLKGNFIESLRLFLNKPFLNKKLKNFLLLLIPTALLNKLMWYQ